MKKFMPMAKKKDRRGAKASMPRPFFMAARAYSRPSARVNASFQGSVGTSFLDVVTGNGNGVEAWHILAGVLHDIANDFHRWCWWVDVSVAHHEFFENIVLDGTCELLRLNALFFGGHNVVSQDWQKPHRSWSWRRKLYRAECCQKESSCLQRSR